MTWQDHSGADYDIYVHHFSPDGVVLSVPPMELLLPAAMPVRMEVLDVGGRRVLESETTSLTAGTHVLAWNGRTSDGRRAADGIYFLRVKGQGLAVSRSVIRLN